jgi:single-strand DNA-binding protein
MEVVMIHGELEFRQNGRLAAPPSFKKNPNGSKVANFRLITNVSWRDKASGEQHDRAEGFGFELWGDQAEVFANLNLDKGTELTVKAEPINHTYKDEKTGEDRYRIRFRVTSWRLHGGRRTEGAATGTSAPVGGDASEEPGDVPF